MADRFRPVYWYAQTTRRGAIRTARALTLYPDRTEAGKMRLPTATIPTPPHAGEFHVPIRLLVHARVLGVIARLRPHRGTQNASG